MNKLSIFFVRNAVGYEKDRFQKLLDEERREHDNQLKLWQKYMNKYVKDHQEKLPEKEKDIILCIKEDKPINKLLEKPIEGGIKNITLPNIKIECENATPFILLESKDTDNVLIKDYKENSIDLSILKQSTEFIESLFSEHIFTDAPIKPESEPTSQLNSPTINSKFRLIRSQKIKQLVELFEQGLDHRSDCD